MFTTYMIYILIQHIYDLNSIHDYITAIHSYSYTIFLFGLKIITLAVQMRINI